MLRFAKENGGNFLKKRCIIAFCPEAQYVRDAKLCKERYCTFCEVFRTSGGIADGQLDDKVGAAKQSHAGARVLVKDSRLSALHVVGTHYDNCVISACRFLCFSDMVFVPCMERIVFCNDSDCARMFLLQIFVQYDLSDSSKNSCFCSIFNTIALFPILTDKKRRCNVNFILSLVRIWVIIKITQK